MMKTLEELHPYISIYTNIRLLMKEARLLLDTLIAYDYSIMHWHLDN